MRRNAEGARSAGGRSLARIPDSSTGRSSRRAAAEPARVVKLFALDFGRSSRHSLTPPPQGCISADEGSIDSPRRHPRDHALHE